LRQGRDDRGCAADFVTFEDFFVKSIRVERPRGRDSPFDIFELMVRVQEGLCHRPIDEARIEVPQAVMKREPFAQRALAGSGRPIDGNDHAEPCCMALSANRSLKSPVKVGKSSRAAMSISRLEARSKTKKNSASAVAGEAPATIFLKVSARLID